MAKLISRATVLLLLIASTPLVSGHGRLLKPPSRSSMWRLGYPTVPNYTDNELFCGGFDVQKANGMRCGVCGDPYHARSPQDNMMGGKYYKGIITAKYSAGEEVTVTVQLTANHYGFFEFRLCPVNGNAALETEACMQQHPIEVIGAGRRNGYPNRYYVPTKTPDTYNIRLRIPDISCTQCVFQWTYTAGNNWGKCKDGSHAVGCGPQETFRGCADVSIAARGQSITSPPPTSSLLPLWPTRTSPESRPAPFPAAGTKCVAVYGYAARAGMNQWCNANCNHWPPRCPKSMCSCA